MGLSRQFKAVYRCVHIRALALLCLLTTQAWAQDSLVLPDQADVAYRLSVLEHRHEALMQTAVVARFLQRAGREAVSPATMNEDAAWLRRIEDRFGVRTVRSPVLDPAAWLVHIELMQRSLPDQSLVSPAGPDAAVYLDRVFERTEERMASVLLPELLWTLEPTALDTWRRFGELLAGDEGLSQAFAETAPDWIQQWAGSSAGFEPVALDPFAERVTSALASMAAATVTAGPPDMTLLASVRFHALSSLDGLEGRERDEAIAFMRLADLVDGLHEGRYFALAEGLVALAGAALRMADQPGESAVLPWMVEQLPEISNAYSRELSAIDPRLNSAVAAAFDVVSVLARPEQERGELQELRRELGDAVAQLALLVPDLGYYFNLPVRDSIAGGMDACTGLMARTEEDGSPAMTRELFNDCQQSIVDLADEEARAAALAGDPDGPFGDEPLSRELSVTSGQRINYGIGYLHDRYSTACPEPEQPLPNPLEWSALATLLSWFAEQSPIYFQTPENEARLNRMRDIGNELLEVIAAQVDCFAGSGAAVNDPISRTLIDYRAALGTLTSGITAAMADFRGEMLAENADVALHRDATQPTAYRPEELMIGPCDPENVCEMSGALTSTRALLGLFPDEYLVADQTRLGTIEICYEDMAWERRRSEQVRPDDTNVANYFGFLTFNLRGRFHYQDRVDEIFGFHFTSPDEQHYLFAAATEEVLNDSCPVEWVGQKIVTPLRSSFGGIVPNRLTYLAAPRMVPSRLLGANWDRGAEWRDWFITGIGVEPLDLEPAPDLTGDLNQHLQAMYRSEQAEVYDSILRPPSRGLASFLNSAFEDAARLTTIKALIRQQLMLFYPQVLNESDELRSAIAGHRGLLDNVVLNRFRTDNVPVNTINSIAFERLGRIEQAWRSQPELVRRTGSVAGSLAHAMMRLNALYDRYFAAQPEPVEADLEVNPSPEGG